MGEMDLIYLVVGVGLGLVGSRFTRLLQAPKGSQPTVPQGTDSKELFQLQEELKQTHLAYEMAREMSQFKGGFLARTSHELRSPLSSLIGLHQLILSDLCDSPEEAKDFVAQANASALKMVKLLDEVIAVAKTEHGTNRMEARAVQLKTVFEDLERLTHLQAANRNLQLEIIPPDPDIYLLTDPRRCRQVLLGLVDTAMAHMQEGSIRIWAATVPELEAVHIGIDIECANNAWCEAVDLLSQPPEPETAATATFNISPGLTLLMVQALLEVMQGRLDILPVAEDDDSPSKTRTTRLQCSMPLATPESGEPVLLEE